MLAKIEQKQMLYIKRKLNLCKNSPHDDKTCFSLEKFQFLGGGVEFSTPPPLRPLCKDKTSGLEGLNK